MCGHAVHSNFAACCRAETPGITRLAAPFRVSIEKLAVLMCGRRFSGLCRYLFLKRKRSHGSVSDGIDASAAGMTDCSEWVEAVLLFAGMCRHVAEARKLWGRTFASISFVACALGDGMPFLHLRSEILGRVFVFRVFQTRHGLMGCVSLWRRNRRSQYLPGVYRPFSPDSHFSSHMWWRCGFAAELRDEVA